jgi:hypothetical protein
MLNSELLLAKRFSSERPGLDLLGIEKAAVPVTVVATDVLAQEIKPLPLLQEFVLRLVKANVGGASDIAAFLGLDRKLVDAVVADHYRDGTLSFSPGLGQLLLTDRGKRLADELEAVRPIQRTFQVVFDRLTWSVADYDSRELVTKAVALVEGRILLPAQRTTRVKTTDVTPAAVNSFLRKPGRTVSIDVLDVIDVAPSTYRYMPVDILVYGDQERGEVETAVVVDGDPSDEHDAALSKLTGTDKLNFQVAPARPHAVLPPHLEAERVSPTQGAPLEENSPRVRGIDLLNHQFVLMTALERAQNRILIAVDLANCSVLDTYFLSRLEQRLRAHVQVDLIVSRIDREAEAALDRLASRYRRRMRLHLPESEIPNTLVFDDNWIVSDFPWLSYRGSGRPFRVYRGTVVAVADEADREYTALLSTFAA